MLQIKKDTATIPEYKVGSNANIANFMRLWKPRMSAVSEAYSPRCTFLD